MRAELAILHHCAVLFLSRAGANCAGITIPSQHHVGYIRTILRQNFRLGLGYGLWYWLGLGYRLGFWLDLEYGLGWVRACCNIVLSQYSARTSYMFRAKVKYLT